MSYIEAICSDGARGREASATMSTHVECTRVEFCDHPDTTPHCAICAFPWPCADDLLFDDGPYEPECWGLNSYEHYKGECQHFELDRAPAPPRLRFTVERPGSGGWAGKRAPR